MLFYSCYIYLFCAFVCFFCLFFFFFKQKTAYEMRISDWSSDVCSSDLLKNAYRAYALGLAHKHVPEIRARGGLERAPLFVPAVGNYYKGMLVQVPLQLWALPGAPSPVELRRALADHYAGQDFVRVAPAEEDRKSTRLNSSP